MIRLIQRRLIIPRGDTGSFSIPINNEITNDAVAVFSIFDPMTRKTVFFKNIALNDETKSLTVSLTHEDTNLEPKKYLWDIKIYTNPVYEDDEIEFEKREIINGDEINSYYAAFSLPICEIREVAKQ